jgi:hypothetical protein
VFSLQEEPLPSFALHSGGIPSQRPLQQVLLITQPPPLLVQVGTAMQTLATQLLPLGQSELESQTQTPARQVPLLQADDAVQKPPRPTELGLTQIPALQTPLAHAPWEVQTSPLGAPPQNPPRQSPFVHSSSKRHT